MPCPRCGHPAEASESACARCGVVFAKLQRRPGPPAGPAPEAAGTRPGWALPALALAAGLLGGYAMLRRPAPAAPAAAAVGEAARAPEQGEPPPPSVPPATPQPAAAGAPGAPAMPAWLNG